MLAFRKILRLTKMDDPLNYEFSGKFQKDKFLLLALQLKTVCLVILNKLLLHPPIQSPEN